MGRGKQYRNKPKDREKPLNKRRSRTIEFNRLQADEEVRKRVEAILAKKEGKKKE